MSNSKNNNLEDVSKGNDESAPRANDSTSNKKTRFTKSKSISEVFKELEFDDYEENTEFSDDFDDSSVDEIIPIHNEYKDLDKSETLADESVEGGLIINPDTDDLTEDIASESTYEYEVEKGDADFIDDETDSDEFSESLNVKTDFDDEDIDDGDFIAGKNSDEVLADEEIEDKIGKSSAQGVLINDKEKASDSGKSLDIFDSATLISIAGCIVGLGILILGITYYASSSDRVVDNVLSGETAGLAIFLMIIGLIVIGFSLLKFFSSSKSSLIIDTFNSIKSIDYDDVSEDVVSREDFDTLLSIFKRKKDSNFSDDDQSVDGSKDLFEKDQDDELSEDDISSLYSKSNLTSQKNQTSSNEQETANSTEISQDYDDDGVDEIIPIHSKLNEQSEESSLEDKYSKYDFDEDYDEDFDETYDLVDEESANISDLIEENAIEDSPIEDNPNEDNFLDEDFEDSSIEDSYVEEDIVNTQDFDDDADSNLEIEKDDALEDKYSKYDFDDDFDDELDESIESKPKFKKSVDLSKFDSESLSEDELAEQKLKAHEEMLEKKRRIIEGTNFDNSLRKQ